MPWFVPKLLAHARPHRDDRQPARALPIQEPARTRKATKSATESMSPAHIADGQQVSPCYRTSQPGIRSPVEEESENR